jgi:hypothetical protein
VTPFGQLVILTAMTAGVDTVYVLAGVTPSAAAALLLDYSFPLFVAYWLVADASQRRRLPCWDFGYLVALAFPVSLLGYLYWTRGWRGLWLLAALTALWLAPWLCSMAVGLVMSAVS